MIGRVLAGVLACLALASVARAQNHYTLQVTSPNTSYQGANHYNFHAYTGVAYERAVTPFGGCAPFTATLTAAPSGMVIREHTRRPGAAGMPGPTGVFQGQAFELSWPSPTGTTATVTIQITDCDGSTATSSFTLNIGTTRFKFFDAAAGSDANACTLAAPCQTLAAHYNIAKAGPTHIGVYKTGTYHLAGVGLPTSSTGDNVHVDWNTADGRSTQFIAYPGHTPVMDFDYAFAGVAVNHIWMQADDFVLDGFTLQNAYHQGVRLNRRTGDGATVRNTTFGDIGAAIGGSNSGWILWARGMSEGDVLIGNQTEGSGSLDFGIGNIIAKFYDVRYSVVVYNSCATNSNTASDGCIAPKGGLDQFSHRGNYFTGSARAWYGDLANDDGAPAIPSSGEFAYNLLLMSASTTCISIGNRGAAEVVGAVRVYRNTFRCDFWVQNLSSDDAVHTLLRNVHENNGGTGGSCPTPLTCNGVTDYSKLTVTSEFDAAASDLTATGSLTGAALTAHGPASATPKGHMLSASAAADPPTVTSVSPTSGPTTGGTLITITGTNFAATPTITVGGSVCTSPHLTSTTQVECTTPARAAGVVSIVVTNPDTQSGTGTNLYTYSGAEVTTALLQTAQDATDQASGDYSFAAQNLGVAASDRMITVVSLARKSASGSCATPVVVIGGVTATSVVTSVNGTFTCNVAAIHKALVPTNTTGTVTVNYPAAMLHAHIALYRTTGPYAIVATETGSSIADDPTGTLNIAAGGFAIGGSLSSAGVPATWTGLTETFEELFTGSTVNTATGAMLIPATVQSDLPITVDWASSLQSVGVWAAWEPFVAATSPTHYVTPTGNTSSNCTVGDPCTLTRAFALAGGTSMPPGSWVSVAAGIYNQAAITTTGGGVPGAPIRFVGAGDNTTNGSRLTGTRTAFPAASWTLCPASTYSYCATFDDVAQYPVGLFAQRPGPLMTTPWVDIIVDDRYAHTGWAPSGRAFTLNEPVSYTRRTSAAAVELQHCTYYHNLATDTLYMHPCREGVPTNGDQYYAGPDAWGTLTFTGSGDYLSFERFSVEHTGTDKGIRIDSTATGTNLDNIRMLSTVLEAAGRQSTLTDIFVTEAMTQGEPHAECYSIQYGGTGLASRSCWQAFADGYGLLAGIEGIGVTFNQTFDRITIERGWNAIAMTSYNALNHATTYGFGNHSMIVSGTNMSIRNSTFLNAQDNVFMADEDWQGHVYEHNLFNSDVLFYCGRFGSQNGAVCPTAWTFRYNILPAMVTDYMNEPTLTRDCNVWMPRYGAQPYWLSITQVGGSTNQYDTLAEIQGSGPHDDNSIALASGKWYDNSIFANWNHQENYPIDLTLTPTGAAQLTTCGTVAGPDTLTTGEAEPTTAVRIRFRTP